MNEKATLNSIDEYIAGFPSETRRVLEELRALIKATAPEATETISYAMPAFDLKRKHVVHFGGWKKHIGVYPGAYGFGPFQEELKPYETAKGTLQFPLGEPLPTDLLRRIVEFSVAEITRKASK
jgi:uncharacterized protein YdhG (YjbR/CyaY superfamily)